MHSKVLARFKEDIQSHEIKILRDDGVYRHIRFGTGSSIYALNVTTFPGHLVVTGDMGDYVFNRLNDMFEFFRGNDINASYWGEKLVAEPWGSKFGKHWSEEAFKQAIKEYLANNLDDLADLDEEDSKKQKEVIAKIDSEIENISCEEEAYEWIRDFECNDFQFDAFYEYDCTEYTHHYLWVCYAIIEVIKRYDETKSKQQAA